MKAKRKRALEVPPKIRSFINSVITTPLENIEEILKNFVWEFDKGDFHHWVDLFNHFDTFFDKFIKTRKDLQLEDNFLESDPPFPREAILQILRVIRIILENCTNKHFYSSYENHLSCLLASTDGEVVEACLQTLVAFLKKTLGKYIIRDASLSSKLFSIAQGWGGKEEGLGLIACLMQNGSDPIAYELGGTLHFEFYAMNESLNQDHGLKVIHIPNVSTRPETDLELLNKLITEYKVPQSLRFSLLTRLRFARAFNSLESRQQYTCIRLYAFMVLVQACGEPEKLTTFFNSEPEFINELVTLLSYEDSAPEKIRILCLLSLVSLCHDRSRQPTVLTAVTSGGHRGILSSLMQKSIDSVVNNSSKLSVVFAEALLSLVTVLVSSSSGCSAMREAGFIPTLLPLLKDTNPMHLHLVSTAVHVLEAFMDYSNPAAALFRDLGGLDDTISRLKIEVSHFENVEVNQVTVLASSSLENNTHSDALISYHRRLLLKSLLRAISLGTYAPGTAARIYGSEESLLPHCLCTIFKRAKDFGGGVFSLAATVMSDLIHKDPTCFAVLEAAGLPNAFMDAVMEGVLCSAEAITCIPQCLDALCLNNKGLQAVKDRKALRCFVKIFTSRSYLRALTGDTPASLSSSLDELMRHSSTLREPGVEMLIEILNNIGKLGSGLEVAAPLSTDLASSSVPVPMVTDNDVSNDASVNVEAFLPDCINNTCRLLETILQNSDTCRMFVEKKGIEAVLQLFNLSCMPLSVSIGQSVSIAFKNFSQQHSASLARSVCSFLKEFIKSANEILVLIGGTHLAQMEVSKRTEILRCLSSLEGVLALSNSLLKGTTAVITELGTADADVLKDLGRAYKEILWQVSLCCDSKVDKKEVGPESSDVEAASNSNSGGRESDDDTNNLTSLRYMPVTMRNAIQSQWGGEREFLSVIRSAEGITRRSRHGLGRIRGGRTGGRSLEAFQIDPEIISETSAHVIPKNKTPEALVSDNLNKIASTMRSFFTALVKGFTSPNRRRIESGSLSSASKSVGTALAKVFLDALGFSGYPNLAGLDISLSVKCRYLGKVVDDMISLTYDTRRRTCYTAMVNNFYVHGTFKELLTTFEATSQLLWTLPYIPTPGVTDTEKSGKLTHSPWLLETLKSYSRLLDHFVNSSVLLSSTSTSQSQLLVQPVAVGLSIGLFPVPRDPEVFVRMLQSQVLDVILPVWNHPLFPQCNLDFITYIVSLITHIYSGIGDVKQSNRNGLSRSTAQRIVSAPPPDEGTVSTIVEMGFTRARAEEALRRVETNSVEMAMEWLFTHAEDPVQDDDELARALALSLGSSSDSSKLDSSGKSDDLLAEEGQTKAPPVDDILTAIMKLFQSNDSMAYSLSDLLVTLCNRNKGEGREKIISYLVQQLKLCPLEFTNDSSAALSMVSHTLVLLLSEDANAREIAAKNGVVSVAIDILMSLKARTEAECGPLISKCISALLLILDNLLQSRPSLSIDGTVAGSGAGTGTLPDDSAEEHNSNEKKSDDLGKESDLDPVFEKIFGKSTGYLTMEDSHRLLIISCELMKQHVPAMVMQAVLQVCARLTKTHSLSMEFLENGGMVSLFNLPRSCFFPGYDTLASAIIRHLLEDPQTLQTAMELEIRQTLSGSRHAGHVSVKTFLTSMAPVISRDPGIFMKAASSVCELESSGGRTFVVLSKDKEKEKEKTKVSGVVEQGVSFSECVRITETKAQDGGGLSKCLKSSHKKFPVNLTQVIDHLLEILLSDRSEEEDCAGEGSSMEVDEATTKMKGKTKVDEVKKIESESDRVSEKSAGLAKVTFVLKLLSDILLMYVQAVSVILKRDLEICQLGSGGIVHHVLHRLLIIPTNKTAGPDELRDKLSEKASWFLVVLSGRSSEGRKRVISELVKALTSFSNSETGSLLPDKKVLAFVDLVYSILSKNSSSTNLPGSGCSPDIAKNMIEGGVVQCLSSILQVIDLDYPDAPKVVNLILKSLESLTRAANTIEQVGKSDSVNKKKETGPPDVNMSSTPNEPENSQQEEPTAEQHVSEETQNVDNHHHSMEEEHEEAEPVNNPGEEMNNEQIFPVENDDMGDEDDDMGGDDGVEEDEDEDEDEADDGNALMSLADTDLEDHEDTGLGEEYNDDMMDEEDDDFHENRVIEVRWREALDGLEQFQVGPGGGGGLIDVAAEPFEGVNVDDLFGISSPFGFERRRATTTRATFDRPVSNGLQHPLLSRPLQSDENSAGFWNSGIDPLSGRNLDVAHFYMFDTPVLPYDGASASLFNDRLGVAAPPGLGGFSVGLERVPGRRGPGDGRWTDDGQPQAGGQASAIAQAVEERFVTHLSSSNVVVANDTVLDNNNNTVTQQNNDDQHENNPNDENNLELPELTYGVGEFLQSVETIANLVVEDASNMEVDEEERVNDVVDASSSVPLPQGEVAVQDVGPSDEPVPNVQQDVADTETETVQPSPDVTLESVLLGVEADQSDETGINNEAGPTSNEIDPTFLEALPEDLRAEVLASQQAQAQPAPPRNYTPPTAEEIDPEFLAALPPDIQAEVLAQQRAQRIVQQAEGQPVDMDNASIIATFPAELREEVLLTSSEAVLSALPSPLLAEAQMLRDRAMSHYQARSLFGSRHRLNSRRNGVNMGRQTVIDRGVGVTIGRRSTSSLTDSLKLKEFEGEPLLDSNALKALIRLLRLSQPLGKGLLQRLLLNLCAHGNTRAVLVSLLLHMIKPETEGLLASGSEDNNSQRLYGCQSNVVHSRSKLFNGLPPIVLRRALEILAYLATNHSAVSNLLFYFDHSLIPESLESKKGKGKEKVIEGQELSIPSSGDIPLVLFLKLLSEPLFLRSIAHLEQIMGLLQVVVYTATSKLDHQSNPIDAPTQLSQSQSETPPNDAQQEALPLSEPIQEDNKDVKASDSTSDNHGNPSTYDIIMQLPQPDLHNLCVLLGHEGLSDKVYMLAGEVLKKLASVGGPHRKFFVSELSDLAHSLSSSAVNELITLRNTNMLGLSAGSMAGSAVLRVLQTLSSLSEKNEAVNGEENEEHLIMGKLNLALEPLWQELSECIGTMETELSQNTVVLPNIIESSSISSSPLPPGTQRLLPFVEAFFVLCEKLQANNSALQLDLTAREVKESVGTSSSSSSKEVTPGGVTFTRFAEKHRRLLNAFIRQNPNLLEKSLNMMLKAPRLIDFDNKRAYFRSRIRQQHDQHLSGPLRISVRRAYVLEDSYNQLRMRSSQDLKGRLNVHFQGEEGIDAGGLTREWYQLLSRVIFDKGALLFTTVGNNSTFQPNPNSVYQTEHLSYFKFVGRVVAKALFDGQLLDVYFTRSFYKHILGVKVTYHDIEAVDPDYYKNLKWMLENDVSEIPDLTFSMDADEEKHILYEKAEVTDFELKPGGRNIRVTEETKHEYVDLVADHNLTNAIRPQINAFLEGFGELVPRDLISIFNGKELELLISGLPEIELDDLIANTEYTGYVPGSSVIQWFWEAVKGFSKEDMARLLQFVTGTSKVPLEGFKALQGISGPQRFQIHKAYGAPERLPSAHTCFNQLDLPEYTSKEQLQERLLLAIHEASEGFGFG